MPSWSRQRQLFLAGGAVLFLVFVFTVPALLSRERPSCVNDKQDGDERGVDCGGECRYVCAADSMSPLLHFVRLVPLERGLAGAAALLENRDTRAGVHSGAYTFKLYDADNLLVAERRGSVFIPPGKSFAIFEGRIAVGRRKPVRATFQWNAPLQFERMAEEPVLDIRDERFEAGEISRLTAELHNPTRVSLRGVAVTALLFDAQGNVFAASAKEIRKLPETASMPLSFTWPEELAAPARIELLYSVSGR